MILENCKQELYRFVDWMHDPLNLEINCFPVDTLSVCKSLPKTKMLYHEFDTAGLCASSILGDELDLIILNSARSQLEQNFDCGHEIVHKYKHRGIGQDVFSCVAVKNNYNESSGFFEWEANEGSAELLVPYYSILPEIKKAYPFLNKSKDFIQFKRDMSDKYGVTPSVIEIRFESLKYEIQQHIEGIPIKNIKLLTKKQQHNQHIYLESLNDKQYKKMMAERHQFPLYMSNIDVIK